MLGWFRKNNTAGERQKKSTYHLNLVGNTYNYRWGAMNNPLAILNYYNDNPVLFNVINKISQGANQIENKQKTKDGEILDSPNQELQSVWEAPHPMIDKGSFIQSYLTNKCLYGEVFILVVGVNGRPELRVINNKDIVANSSSTEDYPVSYQLANNKSTIFTLKRTTGQYISPDGESMLFIDWDFNPYCYFRGSSPLLPLIPVLDNFNKAVAWNNSLLDNSGRPSGALMVQGENSLSDEQIAALKRQMDINSGSGNAGKPIILEGGLDWKEMGLDPKDMEYRNILYDMAGVIASHYGVPEQFTGLDDQQTYNNLKEARLALYQHAILPKYNSMLSFLNKNIYLPKYDTQISYELESIPAFAESALDNNAKIDAMTSLTDNEKREAMGYPGLEEGGDTLYKPVGIMPIEELSAGFQAGRDLVDG